MDGDRLRWDARSFRGALIGLLSLLAGAVPAAVARDAATAAPTGEALYRRACASCHGADGRGASRSLLSFEEPLPDFTDCSFASREPDADWIAVSHEGGPMRGFAAMMPAFGEALSVGELARVMEHIRSFCGDDAWPRGELNLPRPLLTEKAYPEDEAVYTTSYDGEGSKTSMQEIVFEKRLGPRNQLELVVPFGWRESTDPAGGSDWTSGLGDVAVGMKRALYHDLEKGSIVSVAGEVILPTGDEDRGFGKGTPVLEPFAAFGQILPAGFFLHLQGGLELPVDTDRAEEEAFLRLALGRSFTQGRWGRTWSPMVELLGGKELAAGEDPDWDLVPQVQVTLNTRQHVMLNAGVRLPINDSDVRDTEVLVYLLWDWFDGGFLEGW